MSVNRRRFSPQGRAFNDRMIERIFEKFGDGVVKDTFRVPEGALGELINARDHKEELRGRQGSFLHTPADFALFPGIKDITYSEAFDPGGPLEGAVDGDVVIVYSWEDFIDGELTAAKEQFMSHQTPLIMAYDIFKLDSTKDANFEYTGNLAVPYKVVEVPETEVDPARTDYYYPILGALMQARKEGNLIIAEDSPIFTGELIGTYWNWGYAGTGGSISSDFNGQRDYITAVDGSGNLVTSTSGDIPAHSYCFVQGPIYASRYHQPLEKVVIQAEDRLYETNIPFDGWREIIGIHDKRPLEAEGRLHEVKGDLLLSNSNGHYRIKFDSTGSHFWEINAPKPNIKPVSEPVKIWGFKESFSDDSVKVVGFPGYNDGSDIDYIDSGGNPQTVPSQRAGNEYFINGRIL